MTSTRHDELVEEIAALFCPLCDAYDEFGARCKIYLKPQECDEASLGAELAITLTLKAVADGMPLPGEVGRGETVPNPGGFLVSGWIDYHEGIEKPGLYDVVELIALRKEGTGKEGQEEEG